MFCSKLDNFNSYIKCLSVKRLLKETELDKTQNKTKLLNEQKTQKQIHLECLDLPLPFNVKHN